MSGLDEANILEKMANHVNLMKIPLLLLNVVSAHIGLTAPNPTPQPQEMARYDANQAGDALPFVKIKAPEIQKVRLNIAHLHLMPSDGRLTDDNL